MGLNCRITSTPQDDIDCGWIQTAAYPPPAPPLAGAQRADCAIIGAGFTGLSIARRLAELRPEWRILVLDAQRVGYGASGRCSGFVVDLVDFVMRMRPADRHKYITVARYGIDHLKALVAQEGFDCHWDDRGWLRGAAGDEGIKFLRRTPGWCDDHGIEYEWLDQDGMHAVTGSTFYREGVRMTGYPLVHGAALCVGMATTLPANVELFEHSPVREIQGDAPFTLNAGEGTVTADRLFVATNGYMPSLGFLRQRIFPVYTFGSLTRVLTAEEQAALGGEREWGLLAMDPMGSTVRRTRDQRILIRNWAHYSRRPGVDDALLATMRTYHRRAFAARFPSLEAVEFESTWSGLMGTTRNRQTEFSEPRKNLYFAAGYTAAGIAMGTACGRLLAEHAVGVDSEPLRAAQTMPRPSLMPPDPFRSWGGRWIVGRMNAEAGEYL
jgi:glycine/D-amino acid oxidase-like deaminating enzyme